MAIINEDYHCVYALDPDTIICVPVWIIYALYPIFSPIKELYLHLLTEEFHKENRFNLGSSANL